jgi:DNA invertase Pin-like site-specific DNA recombinase
MAIVGYVRSSNTEDDVASQIAALAKSHCTKIFRDEGAATRSDRPNLDSALTSLKAGDMLVVASLDRIGRSLSHVVSIINELGARGVAFASIAESIDSKDANGIEIIRLFEGLARFERNVAKERRATSGRSAHGRHSGRRPVITPAKLELAKSLIADGLTVREAAARIEVSKTVLYAALRVDHHSSHFRDELADAKSQ